MAKRHDERKCLRSLSKVCRIESNHIIANVDAVIGIHRWGMIDYLVGYCGYFFSRTTKGGKPKPISFSDDETNNSIRAAKKARKEHKLTNKRK